MSVMWRRPSMPSRSRNTPKSVMFLTTPSRISPSWMFSSSSAFLEILSSSRSSRARNDDVFALNVDFKDFEIVVLSDELIEIFDPLIVDLRAGEECFHADIDHQAAFNFADDFSFDDRSFFAMVDNVFPLSLSACFFSRKNDLTIFSFCLIEINFDFVFPRITLRIGKFIDGY